MSFLGKIFNSNTMSGRANVAKATYGSFAALYVIHCLRKRSKRIAEENAKNETSVKCDPKCKQKKAKNVDNNQSEAAKAYTAANASPKGINQNLSQKQMAPKKEMPTDIKESKPIKKTPIVPTSNNPKNIIKTSTPAEAIPSSPESKEKKDRKLTSKINENEATRNNNETKLKVPKTKIDPESQSPYITIGNASKVPAAKVEKVPEAKVKKVPEAKLKNEFKAQSAAMGGSTLSEKKVVNNYKCPEIKIDNESKFPERNTVLDSQCPEKVDERQSQFKDENSSNAEHEIDSTHSGLKVENNAFKSPESKAIPEQNSHNKNTIVSQPTMRKKIMSYITDVLIGEKSQKVNENKSKFPEMKDKNEPNLSKSNNVKDLENPQNKSAKSPEKNFTEVSGTNSNVKNEEASVSKPTIKQKIMSYITETLVTPNSQIVEPSKPKSEPKTDTKSTSSNKNTETENPVDPESESEETDEWEANAKTIFSHIIEGFGFR